MHVRTRARNQDEFIYLINQALDEVGDLRAAIEYDEEFMGEAAIIVEPLSAGLSRILSSVQADNYQTGQGDLLDFLGSLKDTDRRIIPFWPILKLILETHELGYYNDS
jgi:hypothetical protein